MKTIILLFILFFSSNLFSQRITKKDWDTFFKFNKDWEEQISYSGDNEKHEFRFTFDSLNYELNVTQLEIIFSQIRAESNPKWQGFYYFEGENYYARIRTIDCKGCWNKVLIGYWCKSCYDLDLDYFKLHYLNKKAE